MRVHLKLITIIFTLQQSLILFSNGHGIFYTVYHFRMDMVNYPISH